MFGQAFFDHLLILLLTFLHPPTGNLTFSFVANEGPLPHEDAGGYLLGAKEYGGSFRPHLFRGDLNSLLAPALDWPESWWRQVRGRPFIVGLFVDPNQISAADIEAAVKYLRSGPYKNVKARVVFRLARCFNTPPAPLPAPKRINDNE